MSCGLEVKKRNLIEKVKDDFKLNAKSIDFNGTDTATISYGSNNVRDFGNAYGMAERKIKEVNKWSRDTYGKSYGTWAKIHSDGTIIKVSIAIPYQLNSVFEFVDSVDKADIDEAYGIVDGIGQTPNTLLSNWAGDRVQYQNNTEQSDKDYIASEKTIRDLAARMADRIGLKVKYVSDRTLDWKGKLEGDTAVINLAYATLDSVPHELLAHPIIRALKLKSSKTASQSLNENITNGTIKKKC